MKLNSRLVPFWNQSYNIFYVNSKLFNCNTSVIETKKNPTSPKVIDVINHFASVHGKDLWGKEFISDEELHLKTIQRTWAYNKNMEMYSLDQKPEEIENYNYYKVQIFISKRVDKERAYITIEGL